jgi:hypothetical protein
MFRVRNQEPTAYWATARADVALLAWIFQLQLAAPFVSPVAAAGSASRLDQSVSGKWESAMGQTDRHLFLKLTLMG